MPSEFELIDLIARRSGGGDEHIVVGIGDDAAVVRPSPGQNLVFCTDTLVEGVHFLPGTDPQYIGHKALAVNLSDIAAMGATPRWALLSLTLPVADLAWIDGFVTGFSGLSERFGVKLVGGDTTQGPMSVTVQVIGEAAPNRAVRRSGAQVGDAICVSGTLGDAALALVLRRSGKGVDAHLAARLDRPEPRLVLGQHLGELAHSAIDISDGLLADLGHMLKMSGKGADIHTDLLPASEEFRKQGGTLEMQLAGGDDYELLFTLEQAMVPALASHAVTRIGTVTASAGIRCLDANGAVLDEGEHGYEHFS